MKQRNTGTLSQKMIPVKGKQILKQLKYSDQNETRKSQSTGSKEKQNGPKINPI